MACNIYIVQIAVLMVFTGTINTLTTKWADVIKAKGSDGITRDFDHPFVQSFTMFLGELLCLVAFKVLYLYLARRGDGSVDTNGITRGNQSFNPFIFLPAAMCDMIATSLMYIGLNLTNPSSFQMLRGSVIIFVALLSVAFRNRVINWKQWLGMSMVVFGLTVVGLSDVLINKNSSSHSFPNNAITGDLLIVMAQIITATQMVYEEKFVAGKDIPPLQAVGWEGVFGVAVTGITLIPFYFIKVPHPFSNNPRGVLEDALEAFVQMKNNPYLIIALTGTIFSIAFFNFAGLSVTKELSATTRMILDSVRTLFVWMFSLGVDWQKFHPLQILGFFLLILGMFTYNELFPSKATINGWVARCSQRRRGNEPLVESSDE